MNPLAFLPGPVGMAVVWASYFIGVGMAGILAVGVAYCIGLTIGIAAMSGQSA